MNKNKIITDCIELALEYEAKHSKGNLIYKNDLIVIESRKIDNKYHVVLTRDYNCFYHIAFDSNYGRYEMKVYLLSDSALYYDE